MALATELNLAVAWAEPAQPPIAELRERLDQLSATLTSWQRTLSVLVTLGSRVVEEPQRPTVVDEPQRPAVRLSRYERQSAGLPRIGRNVSQINAEIRSLHVSRGRKARSSA